MSLPIYVLSQQWCCAITVGFWLEPKAIAIRNKAHILLHPPFHPKHTHPRRLLSLPLSPLLWPFFHQNAHGRSHSYTIHGIDSHTKERLEPQDNPYPSTDMEVHPWMMIWYSLHVGIVVHLCRVVFYSMNILEQSFGCSFSRFKVVRERCNFYLSCPYDYLIPWSNE
jgi:hypothetical protein